MRRRRASSALVLVAILASGLAGADAARGEPLDFTGIDGQVHQPAPLIVDGLDGQLFYGPELDLACRVGAGLATPLGKLSKLARIIERSGRTVVFTLAPGASTVIGSELGPAPHGRCDREGIAAQSTVLDTYSDGSYLPLRPWLTGQTRRTYWKTDLHWTTVGAARFAKALATKLDPRLGRQQRYRYGTETRVGLLNDYAGRTQPETVPTASPAGAVTVTDAPGTPPWAGYPEFTYSNAWVSRPKQRTWPGRTVLMGDSFMWYALENLRPMFRRGRFIWIGKVPLDEVLDSIVRADTVVFEAYAGFRSPFVYALFRRVVRQALAGDR